MMHIVLGDRREESYRYADYSRYYANLKQRFLVRVEADPVETYPDPRDRCDICRWRNLCEERRVGDDHLCQVAGITQMQIRKLKAHGVETLEALAELREGERVPKMAPETLAKIRHQASLQLRKRQTGEDHVELLPLDPLETRGFFRLPEPNDGDIFFDMEGDPLEEGGLEYLFGVHFFDRGRPGFKSFWGHDRRAEREAFEQFMEFVARRLKKYPKAHIYHYGHYEVTALKRLMSFHGVRENEVDNLLRLGRFVDLYKIVRESLRVSEPRYSIKNMERFYMAPRRGNVTDAAQSLVFYERWKNTGDEKLIREIESYNRDDLRSTYELRQWLLELRPEGIPWAESSSDVIEPVPTDIAAMNPDEQRLAHYRELLVDSLPENRDEWSKEEALRELTFLLLDFHRRAAKPQWWGLFSRRDMSAEELIEDVESIGGMTVESVENSEGRRNSLYCVYRYPEQDTKLKSGDTCVRTDTLDIISNVEIDEENRRVTFHWPKRCGDPPKTLNIGPGGPIKTDSLKEALFCFADTIIDEEDRYKALKSLIAQEIPRVKNLRRGKKIIDESREALPQIIKTVASLNDSHVFIQGPPGTGKTYTAAHVILDLIKRGHRIAVSSNSHKAINNLLSQIEYFAKAQNIKFRGIKKSTNLNPDSAFEGEFIRNVLSNSEAEEFEGQLVAGTAWLFSRDSFDQAFDYLFVDEAGQVALANLIAMGTCAKNIVLLGDQMQLAQPIQGVHPGRSGESTLDYLLNGMATIPRERGIFLKTTRRMHHDVCQFISEAVYDGRLTEEPDNNRRHLVLGKKPHPLLRSSGIRYIPSTHEGCSQRSEEEVFLVRDLYKSLLKQKYTDKNGTVKPVNQENILVVAPYNMQVNLLKRTLPAGARIGTVDKFQGQEAEVVIVSMATSSGDDLPRHIEFLYSKNRLNVAISRAKCLAILVANPALMAIRCTTPEQMALVNTLCWVKDYSDIN